MKQFLSKAKGLIVRLLKTIPLSSEIIGPPKSLVISTKEWVKKFHPKIGPQADYQEIIPTCKLRRIPPRTLDSPIHWKFRREYEESQAAVFVATIPQGRVWGNVGAVITPDDSLLGDVYREFLKTGEENSVFFQFKLISPKIIKSRVAVLATAGSRTYFHWMCDILPRIHLLKLAGQFDSIDYFIINYYQLSFQKETLQILGIPESKIICSTNHWHFHIKADELIVPSLPSKMDVVTRWSCDFLRKSFLFLGTTDTFAVKRIYLSRAKALNRKVRNESEVFQLLSVFGFEVVYTEAMSVVEQAKIFANANCIVAPHGAGLTNIVFCNPGTCVIDLFSPTWVNPCYWVISVELSLNYYYLLGEGQQHPEYYDPIGQSDDILVDTDKLRHLLQLANIV